MKTLGLNARCVTRLRVALAIALLSLVAGLPGAWAEGSKTGELRIDISGLETDRGVLSVALMNSADAFENDSAAFRAASAVVKDGQAFVTFSDLPYGDYAVKTYHDENSNGKLDTNFIGVPVEAFGFSNDAMGRFGPPGFEQAKFLLASEKLRIEIHPASLF